MCMCFVCCVCMYVIVLHVCLLPVEVREGSGPPGTEVTEGCKLHASAGNRTCFLSKSSKCSWAISPASIHFSNIIFYIFPLTTSYIHTIYFDSTDNPPTPISFLLFNFLITGAHILTGGGGWGWIIHRNYTPEENWLTHPSPIHGGMPTDLILYR